MHCTGTNERLLSILNIEQTHEEESVGIACIVGFPDSIDKSNIKYISNT